jgi:hypothetical protein
VVKAACDRPPGHGTGMIDTYKIAIEPSIPTLVATASTTAVEFPRGRFVALTGACVTPPQRQGSHAAAWRCHGRDARVAVHKGMPHLVPVNVPDAEVLAGDGEHGLAQHIRGGIPAYQGREQRPRRRTLGLQARVVEDVAKQVHPNGGTATHVRAMRDAGRPAWREQQRRGSKWQDEKKRHFFCAEKDLKTIPPGNSHATRRGATPCNAEGTAMSEVAAIVNSPGRVGVSREMCDAGAVGMSRAQGFLTSSPREEHLHSGPQRSCRRRITASQPGPSSVASSIGGARSPSP